MRSIPIVLLKILPPQLGKCIYAFISCTGKQERDYFKQEFKELFMHSFLFLSVCECAWKAIIQRTILSKSLNMLGKEQNLFSFNLVLVV